MNRFCQKCSVAVVVWLMAALTVVWAQAAPKASLLPASKIPQISNTYTLKNYTVPGKTAITVHNSPVQRFTDSNGFVLLVQDSPYNDIVAIELLSRCGVGQEGSNLQGYTNLVLAMMQERISADENGDDVTEITGSIVQTQATPDFARISIVTSGEHASYMLKRLTAAVTKGPFSSAEVDKARAKVLAGISGPKGAYSQLYAIFLANFYRYHPYKRTCEGAEAVIKRALPQEINNFYNEYFAPNRTVCAIVGNVGHLKVAEFLLKSFAHLQPYPDKALEVQWEPKSSEKEIYLYSQSELAWVMIGYSAPPVYSGDYAAMRIVYGALGSGLSSRLWTELRENRGLAYEVGASYPDLVGPSHLLCHIITKPATVGEARRRMFAEIDKFKREGMTSQELQDTRGKLIGNYLLEHETNGGKALNLAAAELSGAGYEADARYLRELDQVTLEDVRQVANRYFVKPTLVVARPGGRFYFDW